MPDWTEWLTKVELDGMGNGWPTRDLARSLAASREEVDMMRREGCAAIGALANIFNGLSSPTALESGIPPSLAKEMAGAAANTLALAERCNHAELLDASRALVAEKDEALRSYQREAARIAGGIISGLVIREADDALALTEADMLEVK